MLYKRIRVWISGRSLPQKKKKKNSVECLSPLTPSPFSLSCCSQQSYLTITLPACVGYEMLLVSNKRGCITVLLKTTRTNPYILLILGIFSFSNMRTLTVFAWYLYPAAKPIKHVEVPFYDKLLFNNNQLVRKVFFNRR